MEDPIRNGTALRILIIEDDRDTAIGMAELLRLQGHEVCTAPDGPTALGLARAHPPDVALLDLALPGMDGFEVTRRLRRQRENPRPLLIALTGYGQDEMRRRAEEVGIDLLLVKPAPLDLLQQLLRRFQRTILPRGSLSMGPSTREAAGHPEGR